ncbi:MAG: sigma-70 family RNA polymerase sigma factor [Myxococcota bacterium]
MDPQRLVTDLHRRHYRELLAPLIRILRSFEDAEDIVQDVFAEALRVWSERGVPDEPVAWLRRVTKNRAIDRYRRRRRWETKEQILRASAEDHVEMALGEETLEDDALRLIFTCCHPAVAPEARIALTLRTVCGLTTDEVARSFLIKSTTLQQRIVRAKRKIDVAKIPYIIPEGDALGERMPSVLRTIYLVFNEGYGATGGDELVRRELCEEGIRLGRLLVQLMPARREPKGLLALMLLHHSRRLARTDEHGDLVTLEAQDRSRWDHSLIDEALPLVRESLSSGRFAPTPVSTYAIEAAIAALHAQAKTAEATDWPQIAALYAVLVQRSPGNAVVQLNAAVAVAMAGNFEEGLRRLDVLAAEGTLGRYHLLHAARADLLRRMGRAEESREAFEEALRLATNEVEIRFLQRRLANA